MCGSESQGSRHREWDHNARGAVEDVEKGEFFSFVF